MNKKRGVNMIILSITILVMAILAATAITFLEDTDIINRAKNNTKANNLEQVREIVKIAWNNANSKALVTLEDLENAVNNAITKNNIDTTVYNIIVTEDDVFDSTDFVAPRIASSSMAYTTTTATVNLTFSKLEETDYPVVVEYYIKKTTAPVETYSFKKQVVLTTGTSNSYTFTDLVSATQYNANIILVDANGNKAETTLNLTTQ